MTYLKNEKNGYSHSKIVKGVNYRLAYRPTDLLVNQDIKILEALTPKRLDSLRGTYNKNVYFNLSVSKNNQEILNHFTNDRKQFGIMVNHLAFNMSESICLYTNQKDTLEMIDYIYPRMYGMSRSTDIMIVYSRKEILSMNDSEEIILVIKDLGFDTGEVKFKVPISLIKNEPKLTL